jgi:hypothetical protein
MGVRLGKGIAQPRIKISKKYVRGCTITTQDNTLFLCECVEYYRENYFFDTVLKQNSNVKGDEGCICLDTEGY